MIEMARLGEIWHDDWIYADIFTVSLYKIKSFQTPVTF